MPNDEPIQRLPPADIDRLRQCDEAYRNGATQSEIAAALSPPITRISLRAWINRKGWKFLADHTGHRIVSIQDGTSLKGWLERGDLAPTEEFANVAR